MNRQTNAQEIAEFEEWLTDHEVHTVVAGSSDLRATWIGKRMPSHEFLAACRGEGVAFSDVFFVITRDGKNAVEPAGAAEYPGYFPRKEQGYPDVFLRCDLSTKRIVPWHGQTALVLGDYFLPNGSPVPIASRQLLADQVARASDMGFEALLACEFEFYLLRGDIAALEQSDYKLDPIGSRPYTYSVLRSSVDEALLSGFRQALESIDVPIEALNPETGPGQYEINVHYDSAMRAGDTAFLFKNVIKELAQREGLLASFMAKPRTDWAGSSCHLHQSLLSLDTGQPVFWGGEELSNLSDEGRHFVGGQLATMGDFMAFYAPTVNSYKRLKSYSWAGTTVSWGADNRSVSCRIVGHGVNARRVEQRVCGADVNPYVAMAACLAGGLYGIEHGIEPPPIHQGDAYADEKVERLPRTLGQALDRLESSEVACNIFGCDFINYYVAMLRWEVAQSEGHVSDWEVGHYVETA